MAARNRKSIVHTLFDIGILAKGLDGVLEIAGGLLLLFLTPDQLNSIVRLLTQHELGEDPHDPVAGMMMQAARHLSTSTELFAAFFLLWHGMIKVGLVTALLKRQWWAYPVAIAAFGLFLAYQLYRYLHTHSAWLLGLSLLDLFVIVITWLEYRRVRALPEA